MIVRARTEIDEPLIRKLLACCDKERLTTPPSSYFFESGSSSLRFFLQLIGRGKRVGLQVFTCHTVLNAIVAEGDIPVFLDIDTEYFTTTIQYVREVIDQIDVLLLTHLFGIPNPNYLEIKDLCREHNVVLVDDLCQTFHAKIGDCFLEDLSDNYIYSFFYDKPISSISGGMLKVSAGYKYIADKKSKLLIKSNEEQGRAKLKVLYNTHQLLAPELYRREFRDGCVWKLILGNWPIDWNHKLLSFLVSGKWMYLLNKVIKPMGNDTFGLLSDLEISYLLSMMKRFKSHNDELVDFCSKSGIEIPSYLRDIAITCSVSKRAIIKCHVEVENTQIGLFNWSELICAKEDYKKYPNALSVIQTCTNIPCWMKLPWRTKSI